jgi:hypothetical protein
MHKMAPEGSQMGAESYVEGVGVRDLSGGPHLYRSVRSSNWVVKRRNRMHYTLVQPPRTGI